VEYVRGTRAEIDREEAVAERSCQIRGSVDRRGGWNNGLKTTTAADARRRTLVIRLIGRQFDHRARLGEKQFSHPRSGGDQKAD
jgi:hypothetical protein